jgi:hypothetical protein
VSDLETTAQITLRVLVRGLPLPEGARHEMAGHMVLIMGQSKPSRWTGVEVQRGDLDGVVWTTASETAKVTEQLEAHSKVIAVRMATTDDPAGS